MRTVFDLHLRHQNLWLNRWENWPFQPPNTVHSIVKEMSCSFLAETFKASVSLPVKTFTITFERWYCIFFRGEFNSKVWKPEKNESVLFPITGKIGIMGPRSRFGSPQWLVLNLSTLFSIFLLIAKRKSPLARRRKKLSLYG